MKISYQPKILYDNLGSIIGSAGSIIGDVANLFGQSAANKQAEQYNTQTLQMQRQWALQDVANQNAYNAPAAQMQRLKAAGLNPNLVYGSGVVATGQEQQPRATPTQSFTPANTLSSFSNLGQQLEGSLAQGQDISKTVAETKNLGKDYILKTKEATFKDIQNAIAGSDGRADPAMKQFYQETDQNIEGFSGKKADYDQQSAGVDRLTKSVNFNIIQDENTRQWAENARRAAMQTPNLEAAIQTVQNLAEQNVGIKQSNQNLAATFSDIMASAHLKELQAQNQTQSDSQQKATMQQMVDMIILALSLKNAKQSSPSPAGNNYSPGYQNFKY